MTFDLDRFRLAQERDFDRALQELRDGQKRSHWIWYIFPQLAGLGSSPISEIYGLQGIGESIAYLRDTVLRDRLLVATRAVLAQVQRGQPPDFAHLMGSRVDALKLVSSMTLFREVARRIDDREVAAATDSVLQVALKHGFSECEFTMATLKGSPHVGGEGRARGRCS